ncbi:hypothetical protein Ais01nite_74610 [Asanoa ishikariensis]|uniref:Uncharacterized protein n=1 Tax=Asanoa ishikariensis TaxID=137265 RepID=A0A1H3US72_9ACTN|nr:hypothetical protein [Asanoa ishikariensis]GIF69426.1 hypothetical protein Ais01nite_74610 [Asanoa ishikariensis]SDZ65293.1 hypothetical protein SAMN05421684_7985 [Asanoa ishikariensis]
MVYRIERHEPNVLQLFNDERLIDQDVEQQDDTLADIERWGTGVAWAEDYTSIARWDAEPIADDWQVLIGAAYRYVSWQFEGVSAWDEIGPDGWCSRHVEMGPDGRYTAAAESSAVTNARDAGGTKAVSGYELVYGVVPEVAYGPEAEPHLTPINARAFHDQWIAARNALAPEGRPTP